MAFEIDFPWIESLNASFHIGVDGLSVPLIFLTALLSTLSIYYSAGTIRTRVKEYFAMFHILAMSMFGVFMALDYVLFYLFWEISLVPMYLLIGVWGGENRGYASIKFFIYTLVGSVAMLLAILGTYYATGTFDIIEAAQAQPFMDLPASEALLLSSLAFWGFFLGFALAIAEQFVIVFSYNFFDRHPYRFGCAFVDVNDISFPVTTPYHCRDGIEYPHEMTVYPVECLVYLLTVPALFVSQVVGCFFAVEHY